MGDQEPDAAAPTSAPAKHKACETQETVKPKRVRRQGCVVERTQSSDEEDEDEDEDDSEFFKSMETPISPMIKGSDTSHDLQQQVDALTTRICAIEDELKEDREIKSQRKTVNITQNNGVTIATANIQAYIDLTRHV